MTEKVTEEPLVMGKGRETILVVDDNDVICNLAKDVLESMGYKVLLADSGKSALNFLSGGNGGLPTIDLLITDVIMPGGMNGWELYKKIEEKIPHIKTVFSSGYMENPIVLNEIMENGKHFMGLSPKMFLVRK